MVKPENKSKGREARKRRNARGAETTLGTWLSVAGVVVSITAYLLPQKTPGITVFLLCVIFVLLIYPVANIPFVRDTKNRQLVAAGSLAVVVTLFGVIVWPIPPVPQPPPETAIFMECDWIGMPIRIPGGSKIDVIGLNQKRMENQRSGFYSIDNSSDKETSWPDITVMDRVRKIRDSGSVGYGCKVSNNGSQTLVYMAVPIDLWFGKEKVAVRYSPTVSGLAPGQTFHFYIVNDCAVMVSAAWQEKTKVKTLGEALPREVPLLRRYRNVAEQIMMFFPSKTNWTGQTPCE